MHKVYAEVKHPTTCETVRREHYYFSDYQNAVDRIDALREWYNKQGYGVLYYGYKDDCIEDKGFAPSFSELSPVLFYFKG